MILSIFDAHWQPPGVQGWIVFHWKVKEKSYVRNGQSLWDFFEKVLHMSPNFYKVPIYHRVVLWLFDTILHKV